NLRLEQGDMEHGGSPQEYGCKCRGDRQPASSCTGLSGRAWAGRGPLSSVVAVVAVVAVLVHLHAQFLDLAGQGVAAPAQQYGGIPAPAGTVRSEEHTSELQ